MDDEDQESPVMSAVREEIQVEHWSRRDRWTIRVILIIVCINLSLVILRVLGILF
jgi:hypothetical protein